MKPRKCSDEVIDFIKEARSKWEDGINEELYAIISESKRPFVLVRYVMKITEVIVYFILFFVIVIFTICFICLL